MFKSTLVLALTTLFLITNLQAQWERRFYFQNSDNPWANTASFENGTTGMVSSNTIHTTVPRPNIDTGAIALTRNKGLQWTYSLVLENVKFCEIENTSPGIYYSCANYNLSYGIFAKTFNHGQSWDTTHFDNYLMSISFPSDSVGYLLTDSSKLFRTTDSAKTWQQVARLSYLNKDIQFISDSIGFMIYQRDSLYRTTDAGLSWTKYSFPNFYLGNISFVEDSNVAYFNLFQGDTVFVYKSINMGVTWSQVGKFGYSMGLPKTMEFATVDTGYIGGQFMMYKTIDGGRSWFRQKDNTNSYFHDMISDIECVSADTCYAVGFQLFYRTFNGGDTTIAVGVKDFGKELIKSIKIYPNPIGEQFYVTYSGQEQLQFQLYNLMGQKIEAAVQEEGERYRFSVGHLPKGVYLLEVIGREERASFRLVKE